MTCCVTRRHRILRKSGYSRIRGSELHLSGIRTAQQEIRNSSREPGILTFGDSFGLIKNVRIVLRARFDDVILESSMPASRCLANITYSALDLAINIFTRRYVDSSNLSLLFPCLQLINPHTSVSTVSIYARSIRSIQSNVALFELWEELAEFIKKRLMKAALSSSI